MTRSTRREGPGASGSTPVVGIGASAGGLEALESFFANMPVPSGLAFVVVQHLDPTHVGMLPELIGRATRMPVAQAEAGEVVRPDHVYVIPPNRDIAILHGALQLLEPAAPRGMRLPIDFFFRSLAEDRGDASVGVVLSGMGSDGTLGLRAIREKGGLTLAQAPETAAFDAMPRNAIAAGVADIVAPVSELPDRILGYLGTARPTMPRPTRDAQRGGAVDQILVLVRERTGSDFSLYKRNTILRRIERRMGIHEITSLQDYARFLRQDADEVDILYRELLIGVTSFFRDPATWDHLGASVLPALLSARRGDRILRAWVPACATGEEAYTLAIVLLETLERVHPRWGGTIQIFATDIDANAIEHARRGLYPSGIAADVSPERLERYFVADEGAYRVSKEIRSLVVFATQNLIRDPAFTRMDLISCRNLLIYLGPELQKTVIPLLHYSLNPDGILLLGSAESVSGFRTLFEPADGRERIFRRIGGPENRALVDWAPTGIAWAPRPVDLEPSEARVANIRALADRLLLDRFSPAAVLATPSGDIVYVNGHTGDFLEPAAGKANWNLHAMAREGLRLPLSSAFRAAVVDRTSSVLRSVEIAGSGGTQSVDVTVAPITEAGPLAGMVAVIFAPVGPVRRRRRARPVASERDELVEELRRAQEELATTREEMQASLEALKSTNEELQSTNEELQSTNEELTTSKEEMQSMNEELQVVNTELETRLDDLALANTDMENLIDASAIATVFLDSTLKVRRFTASATALINLIPGDIGRPLSDIRSQLDYPGLTEDAERVLRTLAASEREVRAQGGRWFAVRIAPYRTASNVIDGVVVTFLDISRLKSVEAELAAARAVEPPGPGSIAGTGG